MMLESAANLAQFFNERVYVENSMEQTETKHEEQRYWAHVIIGDRLITRVDPKWHQSHLCDFLESGSGCGSLVAPLPLNPHSID